MKPLCKKQFTRRSGNRARRGFGLIIFWLVPNFPEHFPKNWRSNSIEKPAKKVLVVRLLFRIAIHNEPYYQRYDLVVVICMVLLLNHENRSWTHQHAKYYSIRENAHSTESIIAHVASLYVRIQRAFLRRWIYDVMLFTSNRIYEESQIQCSYRQKSYNEFKKKNGKATKSRNKKRSDEKNAPGCSGVSLANKLISHQR